MLQNLGDKLKGQRWLATIVLGLLALIFAIWGAYGIVNVSFGAPDYGLKVNDERISTETLNRAWQERQAQYQQGLNGAEMSEAQKSLLQQQLIDEYVRQSFHTIFLRPISPYGFAIKSSHRTGYQMDAFLDFYLAGLDHIFEINKKGYNLVEIYTKILLQKILTPEGTGYVDLQSPSGAGLNVLVYNYDGDVYATDESRMLAEMGEHQLTIRDYLRHSNLNVTNKYLQATADTKRMAQDKLVGAILPTGLLSRSKTTLIQ